MTHNLYPFKPITYNLSSEKPVSKCALQTQPAPLHTGVTETRWTALVLNGMIGLSIVCLKPVLAQIPMCVLNGLFFYLGLSAMRGNEFLERVSMLMITDPKQMPKNNPLSTAVPLPVLKKFTIMQIACLAVMWWVKGSPAAMLFPILIAALGPVRIVAGKAGWFTQQELNALDEEVVTDPGYVGAQYA
jgi:solute carrier family 4 (anion exchanger) protein 1